MRLMYVGEKSAFSIWHQDVSNDVERRREKGNYKNVVHCTFYCCLLQLTNNILSCTGWLPACEQVKSKEVIYNKARSPLKHGEAVKRGKKRGEYEKLPPVNTKRQG